MKRVELLAKLEAHVEYLKSLLNSFIIVAQSTKQGLLRIVDDIKSYSLRITRIRERMELQAV